MYFRTPLSVPFLKKLSARFLHCWKAVRPCCCTPDISCLGHCGVLPRIECVAPPMTGQWIFEFFRRGHPKLRNSPTILQYHWNLQVLTNVTVQVSSLCVVWFWRYDRFSAFAAFVRVKLQETKFLKHMNQEQLSAWLSLCAQASDYCCCLSIDSFLYTERCS